MLRFVRGTCLFVVRWPQSQVIQTVGAHIPNSIEEPGVGDSLHTQLPKWRAKKVTPIAATTTITVLLHALSFYFLKHGLVTVTQFFRMMFPKISGQVWIYSDLLRFHLAQDCSLKYVDYVIRLTP